MMFNTKKINNKVVRPIPVNSIDPSKIKGYDLFPNIYANIFICAKKKSGKTSAIAKILRECIDKETRVFVFCPTHNKDESYKKIKMMLDFKEVRNFFFDSIVDEEGVDNLNLIIEELLKESDESEDEEEEEQEIDLNELVVNYDDPNEIRVKVKKKKPGKIAQKIIVIFDDISTELKNKNIPKLLKTNRHFRSKVIISSQYLHDVEPGSRRQFDYWILFGGHDESKLEMVHNNASLSQDFESFKKIYDFATSKKYDFLYIDANQNEYRRNFNEKIIL